MVCGGEQVTRDTDGFYMTPALYTETGNTMRINRGEIFGPVAAVIKIKDYDEALAVANNTEFDFVSRHLHQLIEIRIGLQT